MSKMAAIDVAVRHQLGSDNKGSADYGKTMGATAAGTQAKAPDAGTQAAGAQAGYGYDKNNIQLFLLNVANRLKLDTPALAFDWRSLDLDACLEANLAVLIGHIDSATSGG